MACRSIPLADNPRCLWQSKQSYSYSDVLMTIVAVPEVTNRNIPRPMVVGDMKA